MVIASSQYWNQIHGFTASDAKQDIEGLQTMRTLAQNIAWLIKNIENGKASGIEPPRYEPITLMHFIR